MVGRGQELSVDMPDVWDIDQYSKKQLAKRT
jgi:hypothetical protein